MNKEAKKESSMDKDVEVGVMLGEVREGLKGVAFSMDKLRKEVEKVEKSCSTCREQILVRLVKVEDWTKYQWWAITAAFATIFLLAGWLFTIPRK